VTSRPNPRLKFRTLGARCRLERSKASVTILTLQHVSEPVQVLSEMRRATRPRGVVMAVEAGGPTPFYTISTVPLFLAAARV